MKHTDRINRINADLNEHFPSNRDAFWVNNEGGILGFITLHRGRGGDRINVLWVVARIFRKEPSVRFVLTPSNAYSRESLRRAGYKI